MLIFHKIPAHSTGYSTQKRMSGYDTFFKIQNSKSIFKWHFKINNTNVEKCLKEKRRRRHADKEFEVGSSENNLGEEMFSTTTTTSLSLVREKVVICLEVSDFAKTQT